MNRYEVQEKSFGDFCDELIAKIDALRVEREARSAKMIEILTDISCKLAIFSTDVKSIVKNVGDGK